MAPRPIDPDLPDLGDGDEPRPTARPAPTVDEDLESEQQERVVPSTNVGGAAPSLGGDSGGDLPGPADDLANLSEPEPPPTPELGGFSVKEEELRREPAPDEEE